MNLEDVCRDAHRRERVRAVANGIDYVDAGEDRSTITVHFFNAAPQGLTPAHIRLTGGGRADEIAVADVRPSERAPEAPEKAIDVTLSRAADPTRYAITLEGVSGIDPLYASVSFTFSAASPSVLDCADRNSDAPPPYPAPEIDYLAKDYASFRQLMLDRLATTMPSWTERSVPDVGIAIVELMAYVADYLSYYQDAVATEAYLGTARRRVSVRRHAKLVDYAMHEGCNARAWLHFKSSSDRALDLTDTFFITNCRATGSGATASITAAELERVPAGEYEVFEPLAMVAAPTRCPVGLARHASRVEQAPASATFEIVAAQSEMHFYTWGSRTCWLREGATSATLLDAWAEDRSSSRDDTTGYDEAGGARPRRLQLASGDVLILEERRSPVTGSTADADPAHRHAIRLTSVEPAVDSLYDREEGGRPVVNITWTEADALPFALCLAVLGPAPDCRYLGPDPDGQTRVDLAVALGNVLLVDHGRVVAEAAEPWRGMIGEFEANAALAGVPSIEPACVCAGEGEPEFGPVATARFEPALGRANLTFSAPWSRPPLSAAEILRHDPRAALPRVTVDEVRPGSAPLRWSPRVDLLDSDPIDRHFVVEIDDDRMTRVRFGQGLEVGSGVRVQYRVGNGQAGNVGAEAIRHVVSRGGFLTGLGLEVRNPLSASGGVDPEPTSDVRVTAPHAFKARLERAVTADDYARLAERHPQVQRASASIAWNGSRGSVVVAIDPFGRVTPERSLLKELKRFLFPYRRIGHDLEVVSAAYVPLALSLTVRVRDGYLRGHVYDALLDVFSPRRLRGGALGFFHPDRLTFGESVYPSQLVAAAQRVSGVESAAIRTLTRIVHAPAPPAAAGAPEQAIDTHTEAVLRAGVLQLAPFEIARLDNDPSFPERGVLNIDLQGGR